MFERYQCFFVFKKLQRVMREGSQVLKFSSVHTEKNVCIAYV